MPRRSLHAMVSLLSAASLMVQQVTPALSQAAMTREDYEACQAQDAEGFRKAIEGVTQRALKSGLAGVDYVAAVGDEWRRIGMDQVLDKQVDIAVEEVRNESSLGSLVQSIGNEEKQQELAKAVAERVYRSEPVKAAIEALAMGVGREVGKHIELATQDAAEPAVQCLKSFLGSRYGTTVAATVAGNAGAEFGIDPEKAGVGVSKNDVISQSSEGITGAALIIMRRQLANMAGRIGQRIAGSVLARLVSVVAGGVGLVLIAKDIWDLRKGVLPIIAEELKSKDTKAKVQEELAKSLDEQISEQVKEIGTKAAERMVEIWQEFRRGHARVLDLAERNADFRTFLDTVPPATLPRLDEVTGLVLQSEGETGLLKRLGDGSLDEAVKVLPAAAIDIARETRSVDLALKWSSLAGELLPDAVAHELHKRARPEDLTKASLQRLLSVGDRIAILRLASLDRDARDILFEREPAELKSLAQAHNEGELTSLARYISALPKEPRDRVLVAVAADASVMRALAPDRVRNAILASPDPAAAVDIMLRPASATDAKSIVSDFRAAWDGRVAPVLMWERHPLAIAGLAAALLLLLMVLRRLVAPRRRDSASAT